jgi:hypothetical protein
MIGGFLMFEEELIHMSSITSSALIMTELFMVNLIVKNL